jgi:Xaa-Pro aminopeptidase
MNRQQAQAVCERFGIEALVLADPVNVYHATGFWPQTAAMGHAGSTVAVVPADAAADVVLVTPQFLYYFLDAGAHGSVSGVTFSLYTAPDGEEGAAPPTYFAQAADGFEDAFERSTRAATETLLASGVKSSAIQAVRDAVSGLDSVAVDTFVAQAMVGTERKSVPAEVLLRWIRMIKSPAEITAARHAATTNARVASDAIRSMQIGDSYEALRRAFFAGVGEEGGVPAFIAIDSRAFEGRDGHIREGRCFSIDAVSAYDHYHGDFGRTVIVGEPHPALMRAVDAACAANTAVAQRLGPGMRYSDVMAIGREALAATGVQAFTPSSPHSVGLFHTDEAFENDSLTFAKADHLIEPGMVLSVDCPVLLTDIGGTVHMEDMWLITEQGCEALNDTSDSFIRI